MFMRALYNCRLCLRKWTSQKTKRSSLFNHPTIDLILFTETHTGLSIGPPISGMWSRLNTEKEYENFIMDFTVGPDTTRVDLQTTHALYHCSNRRTKESTFQYRQYKAEESVGVLAHRRLSLAG